MALFFRGLCGALVLLALPVYSADWYQSNAAGMAIEPALSEDTAKQSRYSLSIERMPASSLADSLKQYYSDQYSIELHILFEDGSEYSRRIYCFDQEKRVRLIGNLSKNALDSFDSIEVYDNAGLVTIEQRFASANETLMQYYYRDRMLIRVETALNAQPLTTDYYRYSRSKALRYIERVYHTESLQNQRLSFPYGRRPIDHSFNAPVAMINSDLSEVLSTLHAGGKSVYTNDAQGRILTETLYDAEGKNIGILENIWDGNRIKSVLFRAGEDERRTDYEYDEEGKRIAELNYNKGVLERTVRRQQDNADREIEELYYNGKVILRAVWEQGRRISEERLR
ncbi:MAG: hypothetical protein LBB43_01760 [Spirochaetaceae bacterium]|jgi:antitoxin component YwqK of YwqJK toxin-antitoxin module|nr:hypothetical protein [Spirochaetaceae bacterium]